MYILKQENNSLPRHAQLTPVTPTAKVLFSLVLLYSKL